MGVGGGVVERGERSVKSGRGIASPGVGVESPDAEELRNGDVGKRGECVGPVFARRWGGRGVGVMSAEPSSGVGGRRGDAEAEDDAESVSQCTEIGAVLRDDDVDDDATRVDEEEYDDEDEDIDETDARLTPWIWSQHASHTRASSTGAVGDAKALMGTLRGGLRKSSVEVSSSAVERIEHSAQKTPPHFLQCWISRTRGDRQIRLARRKLRETDRWGGTRTCLRSKMEKRLRQRKMSQRDACESGCTRGDDDGD